MNVLKKRILELAKKYGTTHIGSALSAVDILDEIYPKGEVVVSSGHAGLAYYVVVEKYTGKSADEQYKLTGVHAQMFGSLGHGLGIAVGMALANRRKQIYVLTSDGEWCEGSMYEALRLARELKLKNLHIHVNANGYGGLQKIDQVQLFEQINSFGFPVEFHMTNNYPLKGLKAHYEKLV